jgi:hypothetical protein
VRVKTRVAVVESQAHQRPGIFRLLLQPAWQLKQRHKLCELGERSNLSLEDCGRDVPIINL